MPAHLHRIYLQVRLCQMFPGWTLEYAEQVMADERQLQAILAIITGQNKAEAHKREQARQRGKRR